MSVAKEVQTVPVHFTFSYLSGTAVGQENLTVESYSMTVSKVMESTSFFS